MRAFIVTRVIALPNDEAATEWLESFPRRVWTRVRALAFEWATRAEAEEIAEALRSERTSPFFIFAKPSRPEPEPELPLDRGDAFFAPDPKQEECRRVRSSEPAHHHDWREHAPNCGVE